MKKMTCDTLLELRFLSDIAISPDGKHSAYIRQTPDIDSNGYTADLWLYNNETGSDMKLSALGPVKAFAWLDSERLIFQGKRGAAARTPETRRELTTYYSLPVHGGEAQELFSVPVKGGKAIPLTDGRFVFTAALDTESPDLDGLTEAEAEKTLADYQDRSYDVFQDVPFWTNGLGITSGRRTQLCYYDSAADEMKYLTEPPFKVVAATASGSKVLYTGSLFEDIQTLKHSLHLWDADTGESKCLLPQDRYLIKLFELWGDKAVVCLTDGEKFGNGENGDFYTIDFSTGEMSLLARHSHSCVGSTVGTDCKLGGGYTSRVLGDTLYYISTVEHSSRIEALDLKSGEISVVTGDGSVEFLDAVDGRIQYIAFRENRLSELYEIRDGKEKRLTGANDEILEAYEISQPEFMEADTGADAPIQGWVMKPVGYKPGNSYPAILSIHGGPRLSYGSVFFHEMQVLASAGYFVIFCNPRGSEGRGNEFADIRGKFGTIDYEDIMHFLDAALEKYPDIDPQRLGVGGGSYGGFMTNWIIGHTDRFKAACPQRSIANWTGMEGTADIGFYFVKGQTGASHRDNQALQWKQSPLGYADKVSTPTLFIHSDEDYRCWVLESLEMFMSLKFRGIPSRMCLIKGENHELSRSGRPKQRIRRLEEMLGWYDKYLKT